MKTVNPRPFSGRPPSNHETSSFRDHPPLKLECPYPVVPNPPNMGAQSVISRIYEPHASLLRLNLHAHVDQNSTSGVDPSSVDTSHTSTQRAPDFHQVMTGGTKAPTTPLHIQDSSESLHSLNANLETIKSTFAVFMENRPGVSPIQAMGVKICMLAESWLGWEVNSLVSYLGIMFVCFSEELRSHEGGLYYYKWGAWEPIEKDLRYKRRDSNPSHLPN